VIDQNGNYWYIGNKNGARVTAATPGVGKAMGDLNGAVITFEGKEQVTAYQMTAAAALALIA
jgi:sugar lactone lactonase YvrE